MNFVRSHGSAVEMRAAAPCRVLMYSHDTFGLGHIRRTRAIANALVGASENVSVLIISGSPLAGSFNFAPGIDFVHVPSVTKAENGQYASATLRLDLDEVTALRTALIRETASVFRPDILIADKEPTGFRGELLPTLDLLAAHGTRRVLGIRDVLDDPATLRSEWHEKGAIRALIDRYDDILVYGLEAFYAPLEGVPLPADVARRITYTGYLRRTEPGGPPAITYPRMTRGPFILVTTGGGGDGAGLIDLTLSAYETGLPILLPALIVFGPFLSRTQRRAFQDRIDRLPNVEAIEFDPRIERLMVKAAGIVAMGGYNTFCEILSFDKPALIVPRSKPRMEQTIRARRAAELGLVRIFDESGDAAADSRAMAEALARLGRQAPPSAAGLPTLLDGLPRVTEALFAGGGPAPRAEAAAFGQVGA
ncbi:glycosyltransferase family protein [Rhabdaerophilum calidifontis]|uniref:glycosyltransferase family protein n=1 Tax=Rhabdaerophilum calidifontis TaxID=2604328 RepID=UPI001FE386D6|nr:glycosyltransferase [Rhabdaerophilum calidifontis]